MNFSESGPIPAQGNIAQQIFWYTAFTADMVAPDLPVMNEDGTPKWRMAPSPHGAYWQEGMKVGYQDVGSATISGIDTDRIGHRPHGFMRSSSRRKPSMWPSRITV